MPLVSNMQELPRIDMTKLFNNQVFSRVDIENAADLIYKMLKWVPSERISAKEALEHPFLRVN